MTVFEWRVGMTLETLERQAIQLTLRACHGNKRETAARLGISLQSLYRRLKTMQATSTGEVHEDKQSR